MRKKIRPLPRFRKEQDERDFWNTHDTTEYFDFRDRVRPWDRSSGEINLAEVASRDA
jgi:CopG antitoxin of type II toxin-antitoxin system